MNETTRTHIVYYRRGTLARSFETRMLIGESPLVIDVAETGSFTIMRTPGEDRELAVGFLFAEGMIEHTDDILMLEHCRNVPNLVRVRIAGENRKPIRRNMVVNSSCGLCGRADVDGLVEELGAVDSRLEMSVTVLYDLPAKALIAQPLFRATGASHAAALFGRDGGVQVVCEDLGRHSAADKVVGHALLREMDMSHSGLFLSGRASLEMIIKAARARIPLVAAVGAASAMAVRAAERLGITLCGFVRGDEVVIYSHDWRIQGAESLPKAP